MDDAARTLALDRVNRQFLLEHPAQAADVIDGFGRAAAVQVLAAHDADTLVTVWRHLSPARIDELVPALPEKLLKQALHALDPGVLAISLARISEESRTRCLALLPRRAEAEVRRLMDYPAGSAGRVMDKRIPSFRGEQPVAVTLEQLRQSKPKDLRQLFIVDAERRLIGVVDIHDLMIAEPTDMLKEIARAVSATVSPFDDREEVAQKLRDFQLDSLPVVDIHGRLIGAIRHAALIKTLEEAASVDIQMMVGAGREERALSEPVFAVRKRLPWLLINLATAFLAALVVGLFESTIAQFTALAVLLPVVAGQSGNAGAQALAVTMRGLALREISTRHWFRVLFKETRAGIINGLAIAATTSAAVLAWGLFLNKEYSGLALVIGTAMVLSMVIAGVAGAVIPIALTRLGQDPAQSSTIVLTTVTDVAGFFSFLGIAALLSGLL
ncbi:MAG TPA: magnesium transporter [Gammaproteobacteria bacterium]|nr:magnesium transporter [Gammaproteobacteria bacterium]